MGRIIVGGPWSGQFYIGGGPNEKQCLVALPEYGGYYRVSADGTMVEWVEVTGGKS